MKDLYKALSDDEKKDINAAKDDLQSALNANNMDDVKAKTEALTEKFHTISAKMYQQAQSAQGGPDMAGMGGAQGAGPDMGGAQNAGAASGDDNVVDADFEVVDDEEEEKK